MKSATDQFGNIYVTGLSGTVGAGNILIEKFSPSGLLLWSRVIGGSGEDYGSSIAVDAQGNAYVTGKFTGTVDFDLSPEVYNLIDSAGLGELFLLKLDSEGDFVWAKDFNSSGAGNDVIVDSVGHPVVAGFYKGSINVGTELHHANSGLSDMLVIKFDPAGNPIWSQSLPGGGSGVDANGNSIAVDAMNNVYAAGYFKGTISYGGGQPDNVSNPSGNNFDVFAIKWNSGGTRQWIKQFGGPGPEESVHIAADAEGSVYLTGRFGGTADFDPNAGVFNLTANVQGNGLDTFVLKMDSSTNLLWARALTGPGDQQPYDIEVDRDGNVYTVGTFSGGSIDLDPSALEMVVTANGDDGWVSKLNSSGNIVWGQILDSDGGFSMTGTLTASASPWTNPATSTSRASSNPTPAPQSPPLSMTMLPRSSRWGDGPPLPS